jgi:hypothetical protein
MGYGDGEDGGDHRADAARGPQVRAWRPRRSYRPNAERRQQVPGLCNAATAARHTCSGFHGAARAIRHGRARRRTAARPATGQPMIPLPLLRALAWMLAPTIAAALVTMPAHAQTGVAPDLRARALVTALRARAAQVADSAIVDGCHVWVGDTTTQHGEAMGDYLRDSLARTRLVVRTCHDGYRDPYASPAPRTTRLHLETIARRADTVEVVLQATRPRERWRERLTMRVGTSDGITVATLRRDAPVRFPSPPRLPAPGPATDARLREAVVETALAHLWDDLGQLGDDTTAVLVGAWKWPRAAERWLARVAKAYGVAGDTLRAPRRATVGFGPLTQRGDSASADVGMWGGRRCPGTTAWIGSGTAYAYAFERVGGEWRFVSRRAEGHGDAAPCPRRPRRPDGGVTPPA